MLRGRRYWQVLFFASILLFYPSANASQDHDSYVRAESLIVVVHDNSSHDSGAYTQGLEFYNGRLFESTGLYGSSTLREVNPTNGSILRSTSLPDTEFGEGITVVGSEILQLTWKEGIAHRYDLETFELIENHSYEGEGWGLVFDGERLIMSDGSSELQFRNATTFELESTVNVTLNGEPLARINELEMFQGVLLANIYQEEQIVGIDAHSGVVIWNIDASGLKPDGAGVLNGIAFDSSTNSLWITGKLWPNMHNITFTEPVFEDDNSNVSPSPEDTSVTKISSQLSWIPLSIIFALVVTLLAMKLKDNGINPSGGGRLNE